MKALVAAFAAIVIAVAVPLVSAHGAEHSGPGAYEESPEQPFVAGRLMLYAGLAASLGAGLFLLLIPQDGHKALLRTMAGGAVLQAVALLPLSMLEAGYLDVDLATYFGAIEGLTALLRIGLTLLVAVMAWAAWKYLGPWRTLTQLAVGLLVFLAWIQAALSHADGRTDLAIALDWMHLVTAGAWLGGLGVFVVLQWKGERDDSLTRRWSNTALILAIAWLGTGIANAFQSLGTANLAQPDLLWDYPYGRSLLIKAGAAMLVLGLAAVNRMIIHGGPAWLRLPRVRNTLAAESIAAAGVLVMASLLVSSAPLPRDFDPLDYETFEQELHGRHHAGLAYILPYPQVGEEQLLVVDIQNQTTDRPVPWGQISLQVTNLDRGWNRTYEAEYRGGPLAGARAVYFPETGRYLIEVLVLDGGGERLSFGLTL